MLCSVERLPDRLECPPLMIMTSDAVTQTLPHVVILVYSLEWGARTWKPLPGRRGAFPQRRNLTVWLKLSTGLHLLSPPCSSSPLRLFSHRLPLLPPQLLLPTPLFLLYPLLSHSSLSPLPPPLSLLSVSSSPHTLFSLSSSISYSFISSPLPSSPLLSPYLSSPPLPLSLLLSSLSASLLLSPHLYSSLISSPLPLSLLLSPPVSLHSSLSPLPSSLLLSPPLTFSCSSREEAAVLMCLSEIT